jgi:hypothetical protein
MDWTGLDRPVVVCHRTYLHSRLCAQHIGRYRPGETMLQPHRIQKLGTVPYCTMSSSREGKGTGGFTYIHEPCTEIPRSTVGKGKLHLRSGVSSHAVPSPSHVLLGKTCDFSIHIVGPNLSDSFIHAICQGLMRDPP